MAPQELQLRSRKIVERLVNDLPEPEYRFLISKHGTPEDFFIELQGFVEVEILYRVLEQREAGHTPYVDDKTITVEAIFPDGCERLELRRTVYGNMVERLEAYSQGISTGLRVKRKMTSANGMFGIEELESLFEAVGLE